MRTFKNCANNLPIAQSNVHTKFDDDAVNGARNDGLSLHSIITISIVNPRKFSSPFPLCKILPVNMRNSFPFRVEIFFSFAWKKLVQVVYYRNSSATNLARKERCMYGNATVFYCDTERMKTVERQVKCRRGKFSSRSLREKKTFC